MSALKAVAALLLVVMIAGCSGDEEPAYEERPVDSLYNAAMDSLLSRNYVQAAQQFEEVERQHPYSIWAAKAQVMGAYAYFREDEYDDAINAADRFIQLHPTSPDAPYAFYLKALAYYEQIVDVGRDQRTTRQALDALEDVVRRYPETQYARDASLKIDLTRDHLAGKEMSVGRFYLKRGELAAAINRFKRVIERHQTTSHVPEALLRLSEAYSALGLQNEARRMTAILGHNYPGSPWYADAYELVEGVEVEDFPRPDERAFYERWLDPDATIAKAERRDVPNIGPPAPDAVEVAEAPAEPAAQTPGEARAVERRPIETPAAEAAAAAEPARPAPDLPAGDAAPAAAPPSVDATDAAPVLAVEPETQPAREAEASAPTETAATDPTQPGRPSSLTASERAALVAEAESQTLASREAAGEWRRAAALAGTDDGKRRAEANVALAEASAEYWDARAQVARASTQEEEARAELLLAEKSVGYWTAARDAAEDDLARRHAGEALAQAEKVLQYWRENGRRPSWLERVFRSAA